MYGTCTCTYMYESNRNVNDIEEEEKRSGSHCVHMSQNSQEMLRIRILSVHYSVIHYTCTFSLVACSFAKVISVLSGRSVQTLLHMNQVAVNYTRKFTLSLTEKCNTSAKGMYQTLSPPP